MIYTFGKTRISTCSSAEIQQEIQKESQKYVRHAKRDGQPLTPKDNQVPQKILAYYAEADKLSEEKIRLTERIEELITRTRARLDHDLAKVLRLQGDDVPQGMHSYSSFGRAATQQIQESLRAASISLPEAVPIAPVAAASTPPSAPPPTKRLLSLAFCLALANDISIRS